MQSLIDQLEQLSDKNHYDNLMLLILKKNLQQEQFNLNWAENDFLPFFHQLYVAE